MKPKDALTSGSVGYIITGVKTIHDTRVGDTITNAKEPCIFPLAGFKPAQSMVFAGIYPLFTDDYEDLRDALEKLQLNDASLTFVPETSIALGFGFRCGFLGLLHMEIIVERLRREYDIDLISTTPSVEYKVNMDRGDVLVIDNPCEFPDAGKGRVSVEEPFIRGKVIVPKEYVGNVMELCQEKKEVFSLVWIILTILDHFLLMNFH